MSKNEYAVLDFLLYMKNFYLLSPLNEFTPQLVAQIDNIDNALVTQQLVEQLGVDIFAIPWGHYRYIVDKCRNNQSAALFFVKKTLDEGWSRDILLNFLATDLYEREGKALTNFKNTLPETSSDLAQELTKDPYNFAFTGLTESYNEKILKDCGQNSLMWQMLNDPCQTSKTYSLARVMQQRYAMMLIMQ